MMKGILVEREMHRLPFLPHRTLTFPTLLPKFRIQCCEPEAALSGDTIEAGVAAHVHVDDALPLAEEPAREQDDGLCRATRAHETKRLCRGHVRSTLVGMVHPAWESCSSRAAIGISGLSE